jgi:uncharacterized protein with HEPN domain
MRRRIVKGLRDVLASGTSIQSYVAGMTESDYLGNQAVRRSVEREFEIIGEALRRLSSLDAALFARIENARQYIGFRNVLAHGYDIIDDLVVWDVVHSRLPPLLQVVGTLVAEEESLSP